MLRDQDLCGHVNFVDLDGTKRGWMQGLLEMLWGAAAACSYYSCTVPRPVSTPFTYTLDLLFMPLLLTSNNMLLD